MALVFAGPAASSPPAPADQATAYQLDATHDGSIADAGLAAPLTQAWSITLPSSVSYPLIADGMVFVTSSNNTLYAINQATGSTIWSHATSVSVGLTYDRGQVFVLSEGGVLTAFNAASGSLAWSYQLPIQYSFSAPPTATNGIVYVSGAGGGGTVYAVREGDGQLLWMEPVQNGDDSSPAVTSTGVYVSYACQQDYDFDPVTGTLLWHHSTSCQGGGGSTPVVADNTVFARGVGAGSLLLSASTGSELGAFLAGPPPAVVNTVAYVVNSSTLSAVGGDGLGATMWTFAGNGDPWTAPIVADGLVFVGSSGNLYALDAATGATDWSTNLGVSATALAAANGTLVVSAGSKLMAYRTAGAITTAPSNQAPPTIGGSSAVNQIQAADVGIWSGLPSSYAYQWELCDAAGANCADIAGATGPAFTPPAGDLGSTLRVRVVATNGIGSSPPIESASTPLGESPVLVTAPAVSGTARETQQISTTNGAWTSSPTSYLYRWQRCDSSGSNCVEIASATSSQYTLVTADVGHEIRSEVLASNAHGSVSGYVPSGPTSVVVPAGAPVVYISPVISGTASAGYTLYTSDGAWNNPPITGYLYKWQRCDNTGANCVDIANATSATYTLVAADVGYEIRSGVLASNAFGPASGYAPSAPTSVVVPPAGPPAIVTAPVVSGTAVVGHPLSTSNGSWTNMPTGYLYKWQRCDTTGANCVDIANATSVQYALVTADVGYEIRSEVLASNAAGSAASYAPSAPTSVVVPAGPPAIVTAPVVSGTAAVGSQLSTSNGTWTNAPLTGYLYKWQRCDNTGANCVDIANATSSQYAVVTGDVGYEIRSEVLASNAAGSAASYAPSAPSVVPRKPAVITLPKLSGVAKVGKSLSVTTGTWNSATSYAYQWVRCTSLGKSCKKIARATSSSYLLTSADAGHKLKAMVTASNAAGSVTATTSNTSARVKK